MASLKSTIEIERPPADVFAVVSDPSRFPEWQKDVAGVQIEGRGVGAEFATTRQIGPAKQTIVQEITQDDPPHSWAARGISGPILANGRIDIEPLDDGRRSRVTFTLSFDAHGVGRALLPIVERMTRSSAPKSYQNLKQLLERQ